jgi:hypothetical protein
VAIVNKRKTSQDLSVHALQKMLDLSKKNLLAFKKLSPQQNPSLVEDNLATIKAPTLKLSGFSLIATTQPQTQEEELVEILDFHKEKLRS